MLGPCAALVLGAPVPATAGTAGVFSRSVLPACVGFHFPPGPSLLMNAKPTSPALQALASGSRRLSRFEFRCPGGPSSGACPDLRGRRDALFPTSRNAEKRNATRDRGRAGRGRIPWRQRWN